MLCVCVCFCFCFYCFFVVAVAVVVVEYEVLLAEESLLLFWLSWLPLLLFELASETADAICLELFSNVLAAFTLRFESCFALSLACCRVDFHESRFEKIMLFVILIAETALSAKMLTNLVYVWVMESGDAKLLIKLVYLSLYGLHADWRELITAF